MSKTINDWASELYETAYKSGWHDPEVEKSFPECIALIHSELSEALEEWRSGKKSYYTLIDKKGNGKPEGYGIELVDALIRILDTLKQFNIHDIETLIELKNEYNKKRPFRHGNKKV